MAVFDPYGFIADFLLQPKLLMQMAWKCKLSWDELVPEPIFKLWRKWWSDFENLKYLHIERCYVNIDTASSKELHIMVDASETAFAAVAYLRAVNSGDITTSFILGKTRIAPKRLMSMPRLELQAAVLGVRISKIVLEGHDITWDKVVYWSDSQTVIHWIYASERKYKAFVGHRIVEILSVSQPQQWRWVPTEKNTADAATRLSSKFEQSGRWLLGPEFFKEDEAHWPVYSSKPPMYLEEEIHPALLVQASILIIDFNKFSSYLKIKRIMAWVLRASKKWSSGYKKEASSDKRVSPDQTWPISPLSVAELRAAEMKICGMVQGECYVTEVRRLKEGKALPKSSHIYKLQPYLDDAGLLRLRGRLDEASCLPFETRRPIVLPQEHHVTQLLVRHFHELQKHQNASVIINEIRQRFWIPQIRKLLKEIQRKCPTCQMERAKPSPPLMGQLPEERVTPFIRPFTYTGVDLFGPITVAIGRRQEKRWVAIFTCLTIRAAHLEIIENLSTDAFILGLRNFVNRRGTPVRIRCDNGTNFIGAQKELRAHQKLFDTDRIQREGADSYIEWVFNCPANPSSGGCWERLIKIVKRLLHHVFKNSTPRLETLRCVIIEAKNIINSSPLTDVPVEAEDAEPITPNHFLLGCTNSTQTPHPYDEKMCLNKQWRIAQNLKNRMWKQWVQQYLPQLFHRPKWCTKTPPLKINDLVVVCDPALPRSQWQKGRITQVFPARDGEVRIVEVKTAMGLFRRPANRIAALMFGKSE